MCCMQDEMARGGYRTLLIAEREISTQEYDTWQKAYANATVSLAKLGCGWLPVWFVLCCPHASCTAQLLLSAEGGVPP